MLIHCTKRACERLKISPSVTTTEYNPLYSWRLNIVEEGRKRIVVFMHDTSRFCVVLGNIKARDWSKLPNIFLERLREILLAEQVNPDIIDRYLSEAGDIAYLKNNDRKMTAWVNKASEAACIGYCNYEGDIDISLFVNRYLVGTKDEKDYWEPRERFYSCLFEYGLPLKRCRAFELDVRLRALDGWVCQTIIIPAEATFTQLAAVIRSAYGWWRNDNQYHFLLHNDNGYPKLYLREERDPSTYDLPTIIMTGIRLSEYLPKYKIIRFLHDYRANWVLFINLAAEYDNYVGDIPYLESGVGTAPPEDVGGAEGYAEFLDALEHGTHKECQEKTRWGKMYSYEEFNLEKARRKVEHSLRYF